MTYSSYSSLQNDVALLQRQFEQFGLAVICGPTGCGKTHLAHYLYQHSRWTDGLFVAQPAASLVATRFESDLFGHVKGAFSGATSHHKGLLGAAQHGVLCVENIEDLSLENQARFLRFLETRRYRALGDTREQAFEGGLLFTSRFDIASLLERGALREDFYFRLQQAVLQMPPAHWREDDFADVFHQINARLAAQFHASEDDPPFDLDEARKQLQGQALAGGFHSLVNLLSQAWLRQVSPQSLFQDEVAAIEDHGGLPDTGSLTGDLEQVEKALLRRALQRYDCTRTELAAKLGLSRRALMYKLAQHGLREQDVE